MTSRLETGKSLTFFTVYVTDLEILSLSNTALEYSTGVVQEGDLNDLVHLTPLMNAPNSIHLFCGEESNSRLHKRGDARTGSGSKRPRFTHLGDTVQLKNPSLVLLQGLARGGQVYSGRYWGDLDASCLLPHGHGRFQFTGV